MLHRRAALSALLAFSLAPATAQETAERQQLTLDAVLATPSALRPALPRVTWIPGTDVVVAVHNADGTSSVATRPATADEWNTLDQFTAARLAAALEAAGAAEVSAEKLPGFEWIDPQHVRLTRPDGVYHWQIGAEQAERVLAAPEGATASATSEDDALGAWVADHDLVVVRRDGSVAITDDGSEDIVYGGAAHRAEFGITDGLWWDPTGRYLAFSREDQSPITVYPYADITEQPPKPRHGRYPFAGAPHSVVTIGVYDTGTDQLVYLEGDTGLDLYQTNVTFSPDGKQIYVAQVNRAQTHAILVRFDSATGKLDKTLFTEVDEQWIEPENGPIFAGDASGSFLWFSPRDGYRHLYLYDAEGALVRQVTHGAFDVRECLGIQDNGTVHVMASGDNPLEMHLWRANLDGSEMVRLTRAPGWHSCTLSNHGELALDRHSSLTHPGSIELLPLDGGPARSLFVADDPTEDYETADSRFFSIGAADGTTLHGLLLVPPGARDSEQKLPVLQYVYGGPHSQLVRDTWLGGASPWLHYMASAGTVVCVLDNRGTDNRGIEFAQSVFRRLSTLEVDDQARALAWVRKLPFVDPERAGVHGWSYGGYMTLSLMLHRPDLYACGVSGAPVTDWAQYETGYTERYMDTPAENPDGYQASSVLEQAAALEGRLLLIQGTDDRTVMWSHSMRFLQACIEAGVLVDFMAYPMQQHGIRGKARKHLYRLITRFFDEHL